MACDVFAPIELRIIVRRCGQARLLGYALEVPDSIAHERASCQTCQCGKYSASVDWRWH